MGITRDGLNRLPMINDLSSYSRQVEGEREIYPRAWICVIGYYVRSSDWYSSVPLLCRCMDREYIVNSGGKTKRSSIWTTFEWREDRCLMIALDDPTELGIGHRTSANARTRSRARGEKKIPLLPRGLIPQRENMVVLLVGIFSLSFSLVHQYYDSNGFILAYICVHNVWCKPHANRFSPPGFANNSKHIKLTSLFLAPDLRDGPILHVIVEIKSKNLASRIQY